MTATLLKKLTLRTMELDKGTIRAALKAESERVAAAGGNADATKLDLATIVGISNKAAPGQTEMGSFLKLVGQFQGINALTGENFTAPVCILPEFISAPLGAALTDGAGEVEFAVVVGARINEKSAVGYEFTARPLVESKPTDQMSRLLALAAPAAQQTPTAIEIAAASAPATASAAEPAPAAKQPSKKK